jgi:hypothetical protein
LHVDRTRFLMITSALAAACARSPGVASGGKPPPSELAGAGVAGGSGVVDLPEPESADVDDEEVPIASGCDDMAGSPPSCNQMRLPGPTCEQGMNVPVNVCDAIRKIAKPRIAEALVSCLVEHSLGGGRCGPEDWVGDCPARALEKLCSVDRAYERQCSEIESRCSRYRYGGKGFNADQCVRFMSSVLPSERAEALTCVSEGCGIEHCFVSLAYGKTW